MPLCVVRSSASRVRLPLMATRLMDISPSYQMQAHTAMTPIHETSIIANAAYPAFPSAIMQTALSRALRAVSANVGAHFLFPRIPIFSRCP